MRRTTMLVLTGLLASFAQAEVTQPLKEEAAVEIVEVPVYVTDKGGRPVTDLKQEEFAVFEDGKQRELLFAQLIGTGPSAEIPEGAVESRRHFVLFFDLTFNELQGLKRARDAAVQFVEKQLPPSEPVAVFEFSLVDGMKMCLNFTTDRRRIVDAIGSVGIIKARDFLADSAGLIRVPDRSEWAGLTSTRTAQEELAEDQLVTVKTGMSRLDTLAYRNIVKNYLIEVRDLARSLDVLPGRKYVVYFSAGFDAKVLGGQTLREAAEDTEKQIRGTFVGIDPAAREIDQGLISLLEAAMSGFSSSDCRLYCIDPSGTTMGVDVADTDPNRDVLAASLRRQTSLDMFAIETGGKTFKNMNDLAGPLSTIIMETRQYYLLAYSAPPGKSEGDYHKIRVDVTRPGLDVKFRKGYYESKPFTRFSEIERNIQIADIVNKDSHKDRLALNLQTLVFPPGAKDSQWKEFARVVVQLAVPGQQFGAIDKQIELDIYGFATLPGPTIVDYFHGRFKFKEKGDLERLARGGVNYSDMLLLTPGQYKLKLVVRNNSTGDVATRDVSVTVPNFGSPGLHMATPCFLAKGSDWINVRGFDPARPPERLKDVDVAYPLSFRDQAVAAKIYPNLADKGEHLVLVKLFNVQQNPATRKPAASIDWQVVDSEGRVEGVPEFALTQSTQQPGNSYELLFKVATKDLSNGLHWLRLTAFDPIAKTSVVDSIPFFLE